MTAKNTFGADTDEDVTDWGQENVEEKARRDRDIDIVERLRLGGPNAMEVVDRAADEIEKLRKLLSDIDTTMCVHGKVDAGTDLHDRIQSAYGVE